MRDDKWYSTIDIDWLIQFVHDNPWATIVTNSPNGLVASHYPIMLDDSDPEGFTLIGHIGIPDDEILQFNDEEILIIVEGPGAYISSSWYVAPGAVPTWDYQVAHFYGVPELLTPEENWEMLRKLVNKFEDLMPHPRPFAGTPEDEAYARLFAGGAIGFRVEVTRFIAKNKLSQDKPRESVERIIKGMEQGSPYCDPRFVEIMKQAHGIA
jgi:transcriptional regulator